MQMITKNFAYFEFKPSGTPTTWMPENSYQKFLIETLAKNLQIVRSAIPDKCSMTITSAIRTAADFIRLKGLGYNPSETSDHFCGNAIPIENISKNYPKFGPTYFHSAGAADVVPNGMTPDALFNLSIDLVKNKKCNFGQIIFEQDPVKKTQWVHFANDYTKIFSPEMIQFLGRAQFLVSKDGGKSYIEYKPS